MKKAKSIEFLSKRMVLKFQLMQSAYSNGQLKQRQAALGVLAILPEVKNVFVVDEDVDIFDPYDVEWALTTRFKPDLDIIHVPGVRCHPGDPTAKKIYDPTLRDNGLAYKTIYDATVPFEHKNTIFLRPDYLDVDIQEKL